MPKLDHRVGDRLTALSSSTGRREVQPGERPHDSTGRPGALSYSDADDTPLVPTATRRVVSLDQSNSNGGHSYPESSSKALAKTTVGVERQARKDGLIGFDVSNDGDGPGPIRDGHNHAVGSLCLQNVHVFDVVADLVGVRHDGICRFRQVEDRELMRNLPVVRVVGYSPRQWG